MLFATKHLRWGEHRGGMFVEVEGMDASGSQRRRSWHLIAEGNDGPYIPSMAVEALIRRSLNGQEPPSGARAATQELELGDYQTLFSGRTIVTGVRDDPPMQAAPLYARVLGTAWDRLPAEIRVMHSVFDASGRACVERGRGILARLAAGIAGFPDAVQDTPVSVRFDIKDGEETWVRKFGGKSFSSRQFAGLGKQERLLCERFGPLTFAIALVLAEDRLSLVLRAWSFLGIRLPPWLGPCAVAYETVEDGKFHFHVEISHRFTGVIVRYRGWLEPGRRRGLACVPDGGVTQPPG
jgi:hypothetical protein